MKVYLATVAMEKNRWSTKQPSFEVSAFVKRAMADGFDGIELWENHYLLASDEEKQRLRDSGVPILYNTYLRFDQGITEQFHQVAKAVAVLKASAIKFNIEKSDVPLDTQMETLKAFAAMLPSRVKLLSECHPGTRMEEAEDAKAVFDQLPADRYGAILHLAPVKGDNARRFELYGDRICHLHTQLRKPGTNDRTRLDEQPGVARDYFRALKAWGFDGSISVEFTQDGQTPEETYENCVADLRFIQEAMA